LTHYEVHLKSADIPSPVDAEKFLCEDDGYTVFYARPAPGEKFEETQRFLTSNVKKIEEVECKLEHK
jgi:hypothetical protein